MKTLVAKLFVALVILVGSPTFTLARMLPTPAVASPCGSCGTYTVLPGHYITHSVYLNPGHAHIYISGDGDSDLDLFVYGAFGEAGRGVSRSDDEMVHFDVAGGGWFTVKVVNLGRVYNNTYQLRVVQ